MAKLEKLKRTIKKLKRKLDYQANLADKLKKSKKKIALLKQELSVREKVIADLTRQLDTRQQVGSEKSNDILPVEDNDKQAIIEHKNAWKRHTFLTERYEVHLGDGYDKKTARTMANQDLIDRYGKNVGFTARQLGDILS